MRNEADSRVQEFHSDQATLIIRVLPLVITAKQTHSPAPGRGSSLQVGSRDLPMSDADERAVKFIRYAAARMISHRPKDPCDALRQSSRLISLDTAALCNLMRKERTPA